MSIADNHNAHKKAKFVFALTNNVRRIVSQRHATVASFPVCVFVLLNKFSILVFIHGDSAVSSDHSSTAVLPFGGNNSPLFVRLREHSADNTIFSSADQSMLGYIHTAYG